MNNWLISLWHLLRAFLIIYACLYSGIALATLLPVVIPGSIIGMLILFLLLAFRLVPAAWVRPGSTLLIRYMVLLFVPIGVGVMQYGDLLRAQFGPIMVSCTLSTVVVFLVVSWSAHAMRDERRTSGKPKATNHE